MLTSLAARQLAAPHAMHGGSIARNAWSDMRLGGLEYSARYKLALPLNEDDTLIAMYIPNCFHIATNRPYLKL